MLGELNAFSKICAVSLKVLTIYSVFFFFFLKNVLLTLAVIPSSFLN